MSQILFLLGMTLSSLGLAGLMFAACLVLCGADHQFKLFNLLSNWGFSLLQLGLLILVAGFLWLAVS